MKNITLMFLHMVALISLFLSTSLKASQLSIFEKKRNAYNCEQLLQACRDGSILYVADLLALSASEIDIDFCDGNGDSALHCAVNNGYPQIVGLLLRSGIDTTTKNYDEETALRRAARINYCEVLEEFRKVALIGSCEKNSQDLLKACVSGTLEEVEALLELMGSDYLNINATDPGGNSALHHAVRAGYAALCELLIEKGINTSLRNNRNQTALYLAQEGGDEEVIGVVAEGTALEDRLENSEAFPSDTRRDSSESFDELPFGFDRDSLSFE